MGLIKVHIENFKSIRNCTLEFEQINLLLGENGTGKSNLLSAIQYFFINLISKKESDEIFDNNNKLRNEVKIAITFDLTRIKKNCYVNLRNKDSRYKSYYNRIVGSISGNVITIEMRKIKDQQVKWSHDIDIRRLIVSLFPLYFVDSRNIDLMNWESLWKNIGDLVKIENTSGLNVKENIKQVVINEKATEQRLEMVNSIFENSNIKITSFTTNEFAAALSQIYFTGTKFEFKENKLSYFSNGTNSFNYTYLLIYILKMISETKMKEPIIILDEPEISLHNGMIDNLINTFCECSEHIVFVMATHSPRLVKNVLIKDDGHYIIYQVCKDGNYSRISKFNMFYSTQNDFREKYCITDQHASAYFAKSLLLVEGESEMELFQNRYLNSLFEKLRYVEVVKGMSDDVIYRIVSPNKRNYNIPIVTLIDMDKIYDYQNKIKKKYFMFNEKEKYYFFKKDDNKDNSKSNLKSKRKRIFAMAEKCKFQYLYPFFATEDNNYYEFTKVIKSYFNEYRIFVASTTFEGMLITMENKNKILNFLERYYEKIYNDILSTYKYFPESNNKLNFLRLLFNGKSDLILTMKQIKKENVNINNIIINKKSLESTINENKISKTSWVSKWLEFYFCDLAGVDYTNSRAFYMFEKRIMDEEEKQRILKSFEIEFSELYLLLKMVYNTLK